MIVDWGSLIKERACINKEINISNIIPIRPKVLFSSRKERLFLLYFAQFKKIVALSNLIQRIYHNDIRNMLP